MKTHIVHLQTTRVTHGWFVGVQCASSGNTWLYSQILSEDVHCPPADTSEARVVCRCTMCVFILYTTLVVCFGMAHPQTQVKGGWFVLLVYNVRLHFYKTLLLCCLIVWCPLRRKRPCTRTRPQ